MAFPVTTKVWAETMDPYDVVDFQVDLSPLLTTGEGITSFTVTPLAESDLLGLTVGVSTYAPSIAANILTVWLSIASGLQSDSNFVVGATLPIEVSITTNSTPARKKQRTVAVKVIQR